MCTVSYFAFEWMDYMNQLSLGNSWETMSCKSLYEFLKYIYVDLTCTTPRDGPFGTSAPPTVIKIDCHAVHTLLIQEIGFEDQI